MGADLADIKHWLKDLAFGKKIRNFKVVCSNSAVGMDDVTIEKKKRLKLYKGKDPVHVPGVGYEKLAYSFLKNSTGEFNLGVLFAEKKPMVENLMRLSLMNFN
jgi:hypothetical protein